MIMKLTDELFCLQYLYRRFAENGRHMFSNTHEEQECGFGYCFKTTQFNQKLPPERN